MTILIVDDMPEIILAWRSVIERLGIAREIRAAYSMAEALDQMRRLPFPDLILLDLKLGDSRDPLNTLSKVKEFKAINPFALVLVVTGMPDAALPKIARALGADGFRDKLSMASQASLFGAIKDVCRTAAENNPAPAYQRNVDILETVSQLLTPETPAIRQS